MKTNRFLSFIIIAGLIAACGQHDTSKKKAGGPATDKPEGGNPEGVVPPATESVFPEILGESAVSRKDIPYKANAVNGVLYLRTVFDPKSPAKAKVASSIYRILNKPKAPGIIFQDMISPDKKEGDYLPLTEISALTAGEKATIQALLAAGDVKVDLKLEAKDSTSSEFVGQVNEAAPLTTAPTSLMLLGNHEDSRSTTINVDFNPLRNDAKYPVPPPIFIVSEEARVRLNAATAKVPEPADVVTHVKYKKSAPDGQVLAAVFKAAASGSLDPRFKGGCFVALGGKVKDVPKKFESHGALDQLGDPTKAALTAKTMHELLKSQAPGVKFQGVAICRYLGTDANGVAEIGKEANKGPLFYIAETASTPFEIEITE